MNGASASAAEYSWELRLCQALGGIKGKRERERRKPQLRPKKVTASGIPWALIEHDVSQACAGSRRG